MAQHQSNNSKYLLQSQINADLHNSSMSVDDVISSRYKVIHNILYKEALAKMLKQYDMNDKPNTKEDVILTEQVNEDGWDKPSRVLVTVYTKNKSDLPPEFANADLPPVLRYNIDLSNWWGQSDMFGPEPDRKNVSKFTAQNDWTNCQCIYKDYVNAIAIIYNKLDGWKRRIPLSLLDEINRNGLVIPNSEKLDLIRSNNTFTYLHKQRNNEY